MVVISAAGRVGLGCSMGGGLDVISFAGGGDVAQACLVRVRITDSNRLLPCGLLREK